MNLSLVFMRTLFVILSIFFMTLFMISNPTGALHINALIGIVIGVVFGLLLIGFDISFKRFNLRSFNIAIIGIFIGYLMGQALVLVFDAVLEISRISIALHGSWAVVCYLLQPPFGEATNSACARCTRVLRLS